MNSEPIRPPFDPELNTAMVALNLPSTLTNEMIPWLRQNSPGAVSEEALAAAGFEARNKTVPGHEGADIDVTLIQRQGHSGLGPGIIFIHGGGMVSGDRWTGTSDFFEAVQIHGAVLVAVEYRLAPEHPYPIPVEDCYAALSWTAANAPELGIDSDRLIIAGGSAGGGLAAGTTLLARDRKGPALHAQMLLYPMLDDRDATVSTTQFEGVGSWDRGANQMGWAALLGVLRGKDDVPIYAAPARATDLTGLPPTYIECGSAEVFRDEDVAYATSIWAAGGQAELHVWPGGYHAFELSAPSARLSKEVFAARANWLDRMFRHSTGQ